MQNAGSLSIHKGKLGELNLKMWDAVPLCSEDCRLWNECPYDDRRGRCQLRKVYVENVFDSLKLAITNRDELTMHKVGMLLMPLYSSLISLKIEAYSMGGRVRGSSGKVDNIFREIRDTVKLISSFLDELNVKPSGKASNPLDGDGSYYESLLSEGKVPA